LTALGGGRGRVDGIAARDSENYINYSNYTGYRMNTTIQLSKETKSLISTFGTKEDTYEDIIKRMYAMAVKEQLREFLMSSKNTISLEEARRRHFQRWPKSK
jgi:hypothetical protein